MTGPTCLPGRIARLSAGAARLGRWLLAGALLAAVGAALLACGDDPPALDPALAQAVLVAPGDADPGLHLPSDVPAVSFPFVEVQLLAGRRTFALGMLVADTIERRTRGLAYRSSLPRNIGMLYAYPTETTSPFWNVDTHLDLDLALLDADGAVLDILTLAADSATLISPVNPYRFAVALPAGWFAAQLQGADAHFVIPDSVVGLAE